MRLRLYFPMKPHVLTQGFAQNEACVDGASPLPPAKRKVVGKRNGVCPVGWVELYPLLGLKKGHTGLDLIAYHGQPIYASHEGKIEEINTEIERGLGIGIVSQEKYDFDNVGTHYVKTRYWHLKSIGVTMGQIVKAGDFIGLADNTGVSAGDHLHFECKPVSWANGAVFNVLQDNGFFGAIDPTSYFTNIHAVDVQAITEKYNSIIRLMQQMLEYLKTR